jgi:hypothetical protein
MYKRPPLRVNNNTPTKCHEPIKLPEGSFIHKLLNPPPTVRYEMIRQPVYAKDVYITLLKKNYDALGLEYKNPPIPDYVPKIRAEPQKEPVLGCAEQVYVKLRILKNGIIRVKLDTSFATIHEKYYSKQKTPPIKTSIQAYKSMGFSDEFIEKIKKKYDKKIEFGKRISNIIDSVFNKEPAKKPKKKKKEEEEEENELNEDEDIIEDDQEDEDKDNEPEEDETLDVEVDEDLEDEQPQEEEYLSD